MPWLAISAGGIGRILSRDPGLAPDPLLGSGLGWLNPVRDTATLPRAELSCGTLMIEADLSAAAVQAEPLLEFSYVAPVQGHFRLRLLPGGRLELVQRRGREQRRLVLAPFCSSYPERMRITYAWDCATGWARLAVEHPEIAQAAQVHRLCDPFPLAASPLCTRICMPLPGSLAETVDFVALSDRVQPLGSSAGLAAGTRIHTPHGVKPIEALSAGDQVFLSGGETCVVQAIQRRQLPARGLFRPVRLFAPFFGLQEDLTGAGGQCMEMTGPSVEYLFLNETVLVPLRFLVTEDLACFPASAPLVEWYQLVLPRPGRILAEGVALESYRPEAPGMPAARKTPRPVTGPLATAAKDRSPKTLRDAPAAPERIPVLRAFEARSLTSARAL
ncbi:Hint domain-containing protein [Pseudooceanicola sp. HF7]|uniref:Hint domain-containing protein n=1 Tax=Pseudooceanicola sp. HF7 TaxID=2721560 RepID=UPI0014319316|nr:Hint domain-containing protein [Pseudooceanicola sp. HF7]NIZ10099.1 hypothetical protein [Pseudooceanicola sp. HF7]